mmetsp:Transcript_99667/g.266277  ORF Transcript_99667/g.266277 Transcript_99667/m.266277 type:complete len:673 (-) Transcript_99667:31-2049(-)
MVSTHAHLYVFTNEKGGMAGFDKDLQSEVIAEMSKGSSHHQHALKQDRKTDDRIAAMREKIAAMTALDRRNLSKRWEALKAAAGKKVDLSRWCVVLDMDAFFASVEIRDNPSLATKPVAVGGMSMISTTNYVARQYGVRAAMPGFIGQELCKRQGVQLVFVDHHFEKYKEASEQMQSVIREYGDFRCGSLDEAYIDLTDAVRGRAGDGRSEEEVAQALVQELRQKIEGATRLTCSAGIGPTFLSAKVGSDCNKPNGQFMVPRELGKHLNWLGELKIRKVHGVGRVSEKILAALGVETIGDLLGNGPEVLMAFSAGTAGWLMNVACGVAATRLHDVFTPESDGAVTRKSLSAERTFRGEENCEMLRAKCIELCTKVAEGLRTENLAAKSVSVKIKTVEFDVFTKCANSGLFLKTAEEIAKLALPLLESYLPCKLRLMGVRTSNFRGQVSKFDPKQRRLDALFTKPKQALKPAATSFGGEHSASACAAHEDVEYGEDVVSVNSGDNDRDSDSCAATVVAGMHEPAIAETFSATPKAADSCGADSCGVGGIQALSSVPGLPKAEAPIVATEILVGSTLPHCHEAHSVPSCIVDADAATCSAPRSTLARGALELSPGDDVVICCGPKRSATWACDRCTFCNPESRATCEMCHFARKGIASKRARITDWVHGVGSCP